MKYAAIILLLSLGLTAQAQTDSVIQDTINYDDYTTAQDDDSLEDDYTTYEDSQPDKAAPYAPREITPEELEEYKLKKNNPPCPKVPRRRTGLERTADDVVRIVTYGFISKLLY